MLKRAFWQKKKLCGREGSDSSFETCIDRRRSEIKVSSKTKKWYHPGRSGLLSLGSSEGPELAYFGEIHPSIIRKSDLRTDNVLGFEIFLDNIPESRKKIREAKPKFIVSDYSISISNLDKKKLHEIMVGHKGGKLLSLVQDHLKPESSDDAEMFLSVDEDVHARGRV